MNKLKLLTIAYNYPPIRGPEAIQANRLVKYAQQQGIEFDVITRAIGKGNKYRNRIEEYGNVLRTASFDNYFSKAIMRVIGFENYPDAEVLWYPFALKKAETLIKTCSYDYIYTRSVPFTSHLIGLSLKKSFDLPWIAHFSDPWTDSPYIRYKNQKALNMNLNWEKQVITKADKLIFTSKETIDLILKKYPSKFREKAFVLPHSFDKVANIEHTLNRSKKISVVYAGNFYGERTPQDLFMVLRALLKEKADLAEFINFIIVGKMPTKYIKMIENFGLNNIVNYIGEVTYDKCQEYLLESDVLLNIDAPAELSVFLPSKVIEYIAYNKPILSIGPEKGTIASLLNKYGHINISNCDHKQIMDVFCKLCEEGTAWIHFNSKAKEDFLPQTVSKAFKDILEG